MSLQPQPSDDGLRDSICHPETSDQDPSMDFANVNAAYRLLWEERDKLADENQRLREALRWIATYGTHEGDLRHGHEDAMRNIATNATGRIQP